MTSAIDETHDPRRQSWVESANGHGDFPLQNLPLGVFSPPGNNVPDARARGGIAIGDKIFDLKAAHAAGLLTGEAAIAARARPPRTLPAGWTPPLADPPLARPTPKAQRSLTPADYRPEDDETLPEEVRATFRNLAADLRYRDRHLHHPTRED